MPALDNNDVDNFIDPVTVPYKSTAFRYGGIGGVILVLIGLVIHLAGMVNYQELANGGSNTIGNITNVIVWVGAIVMAIKYHRDSELGGFISLGRAFFVGLLTAAVIGIVTTIWSYIFFSFIEPDLIDMMREASFDQMTEEEAEASEGIMNFIMSPGVLSSFALLMTLIAGAVISIIAAAFMRKEY